VQHAGFGNPMESTAAEIDPDFNDMSAIVEYLSNGVLQSAVYEFSDLINACRLLHAFEYHLEGKMIKCKKKAPIINPDGSENWDEAIDIDGKRLELTAAKKSWFGKLFGDQYGGTKFTLADGRRIQFGVRGSNRSRRFTIEILTDPGTPGAPQDTTAAAAQ